MRRRARAGRRYATTALRKLVVEDDRKGRQAAPGRAPRQSPAGSWNRIRSSRASDAPTDLMRAFGALFAPERPGASPRRRSGAATPRPGDTTPGPNHLPATARPTPSASDRLHRRKRRRLRSGPRSRRRVDAYRLPKCGGGRGERRRGDEAHGIDTAHVCGPALSRRCLLRSERETAGAGSRSDARALPGL